MASNEKGLRICSDPRVRQMRQGRNELARDGRWGPRCGGAVDLRIPDIGIVRAGAYHRFLDHRCRRRRRSGLFRRVDRSSFPALHRNLDLDSFALSIAYHLLVSGAWVLRLAWDIALVFLGLPRRPGARGIPARAQLRIYPGRARTRRIEYGDHLPPSAAERDGGDDDVSAVHPVIVRDDVDRARLPRLWPAAWLAFAR